MAQNTLSLRGVCKPGQQVGSPGALGGWAGKGCQAKLPQAHRGWGAPKRTGPLSHGTVTCLVLQNLISRNLAFTGALIRSALRYLVTPTLTGPRLQDSCCEASVEPGLRGEYLGSGYLPVNQGV